MADPTRFPPLAAPFAIVGASAGWLSADLCSGPALDFTVSRPISAACATVAGALSGALFKRRAVGRRYRYELDEPDPALRPRADAWWVHVPILLLAGAGTALLIRFFMDAGWDATPWAARGALCTAAFVPVCLSVLAAGRRAQRARLGSIVADSDRRAVWAILATLLAVMTLEAVPNWLAGSTDWVAGLVVALLLIASAAVLLHVLNADRRASERARTVVGAGFSLREPECGEASDALLPHLDLGLGERLLARSRMSVTPYRDRETATALVRGNPDVAFAVLARAVRRSRVGLLAVVATALVHVLLGSTRIF